MREIQGTCDVFKWQSVQRQRSSQTCLPFRKICLFTIIQSTGEERADQMLPMVIVTTNYAYKVITCNLGAATELQPVIKAVSPSEGCMSGGSSVIIVGDGFFEGVQVVFGNNVVYAEVRTPYCPEQLN